MNFKDIILTWLFVVAVLMSSVYVHEATHREMFRVYGCEEVEVEWFEGYSLAKTSADCTHLPTNLRRDLQKLQGLTEIVGYQVLMPLALIFVIMVIWYFDSTPN